MVFEVSLLHAFIVTLQADEPLSASIPLLADTGPLSLPFKALVRQALPNIDPSPTVSLDGRAGGVMLGASGHTAVTITNAGVLPMLYTIKVGTYRNIAGAMMALPCPEQLQEGAGVLHVGCCVS